MMSAAYGASHILFNKIIGVAIFLRTDTISTEITRRNNNIDIDTSIIDVGRGK